MNAKFPDLQFKHADHRITPSDKPDNYVRFLATVDSLDPEHNKITTKELDCNFYPTNNPTITVSVGDVLLIFGKVLAEGEVEGRAEIVSRDL